MNKKPVTIERELRSRTASIIWKLISTPEGLSRWIAEEVKQEGETLVFTWGKPGQEYETRQARILQSVKHQLIRFRWEDEVNPEACTEIAMSRNDITDDLALVITDYAEPDDMQAMAAMWNHDLDRLQHKTGI